MKKNNKVIDWSKVSKVDRKSFKVWLKEQKYLPIPNFYTEFFNINKVEQLNKYDLEFLAFNFVVLNNKFKDSIVHDFFKVGYGESLNEYFSNSIVDSAPSEIRDTIKKLIDLIIEIIEYKNIGEKDYKKEFSFVEKYWVVADELKNSYYPQFNSWLLFFTKNLYIKQIGFLNVDKKFRKKQLKLSKIERKQFKKEKAKSDNLNQVPEVTIDANLKDIFQQDNSTTKLEPVKKTIAPYEKNSTDIKDADLSNDKK